MLEIKKGLVFNEESHTYYFEGKKCISVSTLLSKYYKSFDKEYWAGVVAEREGRMQMDVLKEWKELAKISTDFGKKIHLYAENYILKKPLPFLVNEKEKKYCKFVREFIDKNTKLEVFGVEHKICSETYLIAGMVDLLLQNSKGNIFIIDWKTNKKLSSNNRYGNNLLPPFEHLQDSSLVKYSLQLGCYKRMLKDDGIDIKKMFLTWVTEEGCKLFECIDLDKEVQIMFDEYLKILGE